VSYAGVRWWNFEWRRVRRDHLILVKEASDIIGYIASIVRDDEFALESGITTNRFGSTGREVRRDVTKRE
jgi:hypothetical protein